jgi:hypothetical protein
MLHGKFHIFACSSTVDDYLSGNDNKLINRIDEESEDYILNVNESDYTNYLFDEFKVDIPYINFEAISGEAIEIKDPRTAKRNSRSTFVFCLPFEGDGKLFHYRTNPSPLSSQLEYIKDSCLCFDLVEWNHAPPDRLNNTKNGVISLIKGFYTTSIPRFVDCN